MNSSSSAAAHARNQAYENMDAGGVTSSLGAIGGVSGGLRNYESMPQLEGHNSNTNDLLSRLNLGGNGGGAGAIEDSYGEVNNTFNWLKNCPLFYILLNLLTFYY